MSRDTAKTKLSRHLLDMKFMKKSKEKAEKDAEDEEHQSLFNSDIMNTIKKEGSMYICEESFVPLMGLLPGRMSFKGRNPDIERLMRDNELKDPQYSKMPGISDEEMAERYSTLVKTMAKKFTKKKHRPSPDPSEERKRKIPKATKFQKPSDDT
ncbi:M-phase phosphoprotein 6 [Ixodes scapularis]|nr:M-phase phosphoprotein 6 [Ixodes scapularis]